MWIESSSGAVFKRTGMHRLDVKFLVEVHNSTNGKPSNSPRWCWGLYNGTEGAISTKQYTCLHWTVNEDICLSTFMKVLVMVDHVSLASGHDSSIRGVMFLHEVLFKWCIPVSLKTAPNLYCAVLQQKTFLLIWYDYMTGNIGSDLEKMIRGFQSWWSRAVFKPNR